MIIRGYNKILGMLLFFVLMHRVRHTNELNTAKQLGQENTQQMQPHVTKTIHNVGNDILEYITFYPKKTANSSEVIERKGILTLRPQAKGTILICHGFMCDKFDISFLRTFFPDYHVMLFDFRAHGEGKEDYCTFGKDEAQEVIAAAHFLKTHPNTQGTKLFGLGLSMGAASLIEAQAKQPLFDALILDCPFDSSKNVIKNSLSNITIDFWGYEFSMPGQRLLQKYALHPYVQPILKQVLKIAFHFDGTQTNTKITNVKPIKSIQKISVPCLFIHCKNDEKFPLAMVQKVYDSARGFKRFWITDGRKHCDSIFHNPEQYTYMTNSFLQNVLQGTTNTLPQDAIIEDGKPNG